MSDRQETQPKNTVQETLAAGKADKANTHTHKQWVLRETTGGERCGGVAVDLEDVKTNASKPVNIRVVDFREESNLGRSHGILLRQEQLELVHTPCPKHKHTSA